MYPSLILSIVLQSEKGAVRRPMTMQGTPLFLRATAFTSNLCNYAPESKDNGGGCDRIASCNSRPQMTVLIFNVITAQNAEQI